MIHLPETMFQTPHLKHRFRQVDHVAIYLLIAGTYTPFMLVNLRGFWGYLLLTVVWALAVTGIAFKLVFVDRLHTAPNGMTLVRG